jgi:starvation-inducible DNA-binding protein
MIVNTMHNLLNETMFVYGLTQFFHFNVEGPMFSQDHAFFGMLYDDFQSSIDDIGENIRKLGALINPNFMAGLPIYKMGLDSKGMYAELLRVLSTYHQTLTDAIKMIGNDPDYQGLYNYLADRQDKVAKHLWMIRSTLKGY